MKVNPADDSNNKSEKYSLRPRGLSLKRDRDNGGIEDEEYETWTPASKSRSKKKSKQRPPPLSKYRRKTANARERCRMREINEGFEALRRVLPKILSENDDNSGGDGSNEKLTKISTLRLAMQYIGALNRILHDTTSLELRSSNTANADSESDGGDSLFGGSEYASSSSSVESSIRSPSVFDCGIACERVVCTDACFRMDGRKISNESKSSRMSTSLASNIALQSLSLPLHLPLSLDDDFGFFIDTKQELLNDDIGADMGNPLDNYLNGIAFDNDEYAFDVDDLNHMAKV